MNSLGHLFSVTFGLTAGFHMLTTVTVMDMSCSHSFFTFTRQFVLLSVTYALKRQWLLGPSQWDYLSLKKQNKQTFTRTNNLCLKTKCRNWHCSSAIQAIAFDAGIPDWMANCSTSDGAKQWKMAQIPATHVRDQTELLPGCSLDHILLSRHQRNYTKEDSLSLSLLNQ